MFTGIIEAIGEVVDIVEEGSNQHFEISSHLTPELKIDQSVCHNGVCLTVTSLSDETYKVTAIDETLKRSNLSALKKGSKVNLERCMPSHGRFDGHIVQGHVDLTAKCTGIQEEAGSWLFDFSYQTENQEYLTVEKGSITINGVSLTCFDSTFESFRVAIIPYTYEHTNFHQLKTGDAVNLEFDIIGKYISKIIARKKS
ncbi:riboflavin synthase [Catalinimonas alkaloidigena]|uniref:riboflavin synthase n=1 Tax=Catalinimonas alkaloidigena TaxID=1075417 RepID=UPI002406AFE5|nr:riboflavin synthase [Catalinimonas alkaloidigena]MDF9795235.1 riboflavin synthase [Catalinimonas alkaloidigena]